MHFCIHSTCHMEPQFPTRGQFCFLGGLLAMSSDIFGRSSWGRERATNTKRVEARDVPNTLGYTGEPKSGANVNRAEVERSWQRRVSEACGVQELSSVYH